MRNEEIGIDPKQAPDFVPHRGKTGMWHVVTLFSALILVESLILLSLGAVNIYLAWALIVLSGAIAASFAITRIQSVLDKTMSAEFLCTQLANSYALDYIFGMIIKRDGTVTYANNGLRELFPQFAHNEGMALEVLFEAGGVAKSDREDVWAKMSRNQEARLTFAMKDSNGHSELYTIDITPLDRPKGFFALRGRLYITKREEQKNTTDEYDTLKRPQVSALSDVMYVVSAYDALPAPNCICDESGRIMSANKAFLSIAGITSEKIESGAYLNEYVNDAQGNPILSSSLHEHREKYLLSDASLRLREVELEFYALKNTNGEHVGYGMIVHS